MSKTCLKVACRSLFTLLYLALARSSHVHTDSFPQHDEYDISILNPDSAFGSPYGGFSRATASRLGSLPLKLPNIAEELTAFEPVYMHMRDSQGQPFVCRVYHEDELDHESLKESMFDTAKLNSDAPKDEDHPDEVQYGHYQSIGHDHIGRRTRTRQLSLPESKKTGIRPVAKDPLEFAMDLDRKLSQLSGMCAQFHHGWWSFEWCYQEKVTQFHVEIDNMINSGQDFKVEDVTSLGTFSSRKVKVVPAIDNDPHNSKMGSKPPAAAFSDEEVELAQVTDIFLDGDNCPDTGKPRVTEVVLRCCSPRVIAKNKGGVLYNGRPHATDLLSLQGVFESDEAVCMYNATVCTPLLCSSEQQPLYDGKEKKEKQLQKVSEPRNLGYDPDEVENMSVLDVLQMVFGASAKSCIQSGTGGWWVYELCPGKHVRQFHEVTLMNRASGGSSTSVETEHVLGKYDPAGHETLPKNSEWKNVVNATDLGIGSSSKSKGQTRSPASHGGNGAYYFQEYSAGDVCDHADVTDSAIKAGEFGEGGIYRATTVRYSCGNQLEMTVKEDSTCHYIVDVTIPALCAHPLFKAPISKKQVVKCLPASF